MRFCARSIGGPQNNAWVRGTHSLFTVPPFLACRISQRTVFVFFRLEYPSYAPLPPSCSQHPQGPVQLSTTLSSTPPNCLTSPLTDAGSSMILDPRRSRLPQPHYNILCPLSRTSLKERTGPQLPPPLLHYLPNYRDRHKFVKQICTFCPSKLRSAWKPSVKIAGTSGGRQVKGPHTA